MNIVRIVGDNQFYARPDGTVTTNAAVALEAWRAARHAANTAVVTLEPYAAQPLGCQARQYSDQMLCRCGRAWDMNDPDPPHCPRNGETSTEIGNKAIAKLKGCAS